LYKQNYFAIVKWSKRNNEGGKMQALHVEIEVNGVKLEVIGNYWLGEAESLDSPGEDPSVEIDKVLTASGDDISGLFGFSEELSNYIKDAALDAHNEGKIWAKTEATLARRELAREES
jgi:hypothetical protein